MKCTICGHRTMPGAMLCGPCRAALKRARYMSVQVAPPSSMMARRTRAGAVPAAGSPRGSAPARSTGTAKAIATTGAKPWTLRGPLLQSMAIAVAAFAALGVAAYLGQPQAPENPRHPDPIAVAPAPVAGMGSAADENLRGSRGIGKDAPGTSTADLPFEAAPPPNAGRSLRNPPPPARPASSPVLLAGQDAEVREPVPEVPRPAAAPPAPVAVLPPPDRWQSMRDDLSRCDREGGLGGFVCDQRVRLATCEGYWGRVAQCPLPPENPGGQ